MVHLGTRNFKMDIDIHAQFIFSLLLWFMLTCNYYQRLLLDNEWRRQRRRRIIICEYYRNTNRRKSILKSGIGCRLIMDMDDVTFQKHLRLTRPQFERLLPLLHAHGFNATPDKKGGLPRVRIEMKVIMLLWYMANNNSFREIGDKFNVANCTAHNIITQGLEIMCNLSSQFIKWPTLCEKQISAGVFRRTSGRDSVIGAIDGCHIRILRPPNHGLDYMNRKGYYSILLQGVCDDRGMFIDIFSGIPGRCHDSRMLRLSPLFDEWPAKLGNHYLLGDSAYISQDYPFILTPKRDNGRLTDQERAENTSLSRGRVVIENAFGRLKCRFRRLRDIQNVNLEILVRIIICGCTLHNFCMDDQFECADHPQGCPREDDD